MSVRRQCGMTCYDARAMKIAIATLTTATAAMAQTRPQVPVIITSHQEDDPCGVGVVEGLDAHGDGFLDVKAGPGPEFERIDKLYNGAEVFVCGNHGDWVSVVYGPMGRWTLQCGLNTPWRQTMAYNGPCSSGWAHSDGVPHRIESSGGHLACTRFG
jgi:hypothetical protein